MDHFYVYGFYEQGSEQPFYIGKGCGNRAENHYLPQNLKQQTIFYCKLRSLIAVNKLPEIKYLAINMSEENAFALEISLIARYGRRNLNTGCLTNLTDGGEGVSGLIHSKESRYKSGNGSRGISQDFDSQIKRGLSLVGRKMRPESVAQSTKTRIEKYGNPVESYNLTTGEMIKQYASVTLVREDGFNRTGVRAVLRGSKRHYKYLGWRYC